MALKTPYLAAENSAMERRSRALHRFLVASPIALLVVVGLVSHLPHAPYPHPAGDQAYDDKVLAYRERVATVQAMKDPEGRPTGDLTKEAEAWREGFASGRLQAIPSAVYEDHFRDGVRGEIVRTGLDLAGALTLRAESDIEGGNAQAGAQEALLAGEVAFGMRNFDLQAHLQCLLLLRRATSLMIRTWPSVPAAAKDAMRPRLQALLVEQSEVDRLAKLEKSQLADYLRRQKLPATDDAPRRSSKNEASPELGAATRGVTFSNLRVNQLLKG